jgi:hypothetical protein
MDKTRITPRSTPGADPMGSDPRPNPSQFEERGSNGSIINRFLNRASRRAAVVLIEVLVDNCCP